MASSSDDERAASLPNDNNNKKKKNKNGDSPHEQLVRPSLRVWLVRHAESQNNQVYRDARFIYSSNGTTPLDEDGWTQYVDTHRRADPELSETGAQQAEVLSDYLAEHLADKPVTFVVSPMRRTVLTIRPTLHKLQQSSAKETTPIHTLLHGFYFESEGCHTKGVPEEGMTVPQLTDLLQLDNNGTTTIKIDSVGFPQPNRGWYVNQSGPETRAQSEDRAARFYLWLCEYLEEQVALLPTTANDSNTPTIVLVGHGDFMSLVLKRIVTGFGHAVETPTVPHRSALVHHNTGVTSLEYFGKGRFLVMQQNATPHFFGNQSNSRHLLTGGTLKDGWSYLMPTDFSVSQSQVEMVYQEQKMDQHVLEQRNALTALYLSSRHTTSTNDNDDDSNTDVQVESDPQHKHFIVKNGLQVVGCATYSEDTDTLSNVAVRPSAQPQHTRQLFRAIQDHSKRLGRSGSLLVLPRTNDSKRLFLNVGFEPVQDGSDSEEHMELKHPSRQDIGKSNL